MNLLTSLTPQQLRHAAEIKEEILELQSQLNQLLGAPPEILIEAPPRKKRRPSARGLANIHTGLRRRFSNNHPELKPKRKRKMSMQQKARLSEIATRRWKAAKAAGKTQL